MSKPKCKLSGTDGNVFCIIAKVSRALKDVGQKDRAEEFSKKALSSESYNDVLCICNDYVKVN